MPQPVIDSEGSGPGQGTEACPTLQYYAIKNSKVTLHFTDLIKPFGLIELPQTKESLTLPSLNNKMG